jgi:hypothetical protein
MWAGTKKMADMNKIDLFPFAPTCFPLYFDYWKYCAPVTECTKKNDDQQFLWSWRVSGIAWRKAVQYGDNV